MEREKIRKNTILEAIFDNVAAQYSSIGPQYFKYFGKILVDNANIKEGDLVLDVASGRGASLFPAAEKAGRSGKVIGIDFSQGMVKETQNEILKSNMLNSSILKMNAEEIEFGNEYFDCVLCGLSMPFFSDYNRVLNEFNRVLKLNGNIGISTWQKKEGKDWSIGKVLEKILPNYLPTQQMNSPSNPHFKRPDFGDEKELYEILSNASFENVRIQKEHKLFFYKSPEEWWQEQLSHAGRTTFDAIRLRGIDYLNKFKAEIFQEFDKQFGTDGIPFEGDILLAYGRK